MLILGFQTRYALPPSNPSVSSSDPPPAIAPSSSNTACNSPCCPSLYATAKGARAPGRPRPQILQPSRTKDLKSPTSTRLSRGRDGCGASSRHQDGNGMCYL